MKKIRAICLILLMAALLLQLPVAVCAAEPTNESVTSGCHSLDATRTLGTDEKLVETSKAIFIFERNSDTLLYQWNADATVYPSSMVKMMTTLVALEKGDPEAMVTVTKRALSYVAIGSVSAGLKSGEQVPLKDLLYFVMVPSANDAATVVAEHVAGSQEAFVDLMNEKAAELGCTGTHFSNAHGLHDENTYTTARDVAKVLDAALDNELFREMFEAKKYTVAATNKNDERVIHTTNYMISKEVVGKYYDSRVTGGKTGSTDQAGRCLAITAQGNDMDLICVIMGAEAEYEEDGLALKFNFSFMEATTLLDHMFSKYQYRQVLYEGQVLQQFAVSGGANQVAVMPAKPLATVLPIGADTESIQWVFGQDVNTVAAPVEKGQAISTVQLWYDNVCIAQTELVAAHGVPVWTEPEESRIEIDRTEDNHGTILAIILGIVLVVVILIILFPFITKKMRRFLIRMQTRKRRTNRRRNR